MSTSQSAYHTAWRRKNNQPKKSQLHRQTRDRIDDSISNPKTPQSIFPKRKAVQSSTRLVNITILPVDKGRKTVDRKYWESKKTTRRHNNPPSTGHWPNRKTGKGDQRDPREVTRHKKDHQRGLLKNEGSRFKCCSVLRTTIGWQRRRSTQTHRFLSWNSSIQVT